MATRLMSPLDAAFLLGESGANLMNIAHLDLFRLPPEAGPDFIGRLLDGFRSHTTAVAPFNRRLAPGVVGRLLPRWETVATLDLDYHLQHHVLPAPGGQRELGALISHLHGIRMDRTHPLWQLHLIEGLADGRVALYLKGHHALIDGGGTIRLARKIMSTDPAARDLPPIWAYRDTRPRLAPTAGAPQAAVGRTGVARSRLAEQVKGAAAQLSGVRALGRMYVPRVVPTSVRRRLPGTGRNAPVTPYSAPATILNRAITAERRVATQSFAMDRIDALAAAGGGTVNDVILAICAGGLRRYLDEIGELPERALVAGMPLSFRPKDSDATEGNAVSMALASLATDIDDVRDRFAAIVASTTAAKEHMGRMPAAAVMGYTLGLMAPFGAALVTGAGAWTPPMFNLVISNMPGPTTPLYYNGMALQEWHAVSIPLHGQALNITVLSYAGRMHVCFTASATLPHVQRLAPYCGEALAELEKAFAA